MLDFQFHNPTKIVLLPGTIGELAKLVPADARALILFGGSSANTRTSPPDISRAILGGAL